MRGIWSIARHTLAQCVRMKLAVAFIVLLAVALAVLPAVMTGDDTLAGRIRALLAYATGVAGILLSLLTIFVGASLVSSDVRSRRIFSLATKPVARWQYMLGRWLGLVLLNAILLAIAGGAIYGIARYLRTRPETRLGPVSLHDRRAVEAEVFTARRRVAPEPPDLTALVAQRIALLRKGGQYENAVEAWMVRSGGDRQGAERLLEAEIRKQVSEKLQSVAPGRVIAWDFSNIEVRGRKTVGKAIVEVPADRGMMVLRAPRGLVSRLRVGAPMLAHGLDARVTRLWLDAVQVRFGPEDALRSRVTSLRKGDEVELRVDPILQITYQVSPVGSLPEGRFNGRWRVFNEDGLRTPWLPLPTTARRKVTLTVSSRILGGKGRMRFALFNASPASVVVLARDVGVLYRVGGFEGNFARAILLIFCQLVFLSAVSVFTGSFVSFPVACLLCFALLPFAMGRAFLAESIKWAGTNPDPFTWLGRWVYPIMNVLLPDFARTMPGDSLVEGMDISWPFVATTAGLDIAVRAAIVLVIACMLFGRRELARAQV